MTGFKSIDWIKSKLAKAGSKLQWQSLTGKIAAVLGRGRHNQPTEPATASSAASDESQIMETLPGPELPEQPPEQRPLRNDWRANIRNSRMQAAKGVGALGLLAAITLGGNQYVKTNTVEVYHVAVNGQEAGIVSSPQVIDDYKLAKYKQLEEKYPDIHMVTNHEDIRITPEKAFKPESDDSAALAKLDGMLTTHAVGVKLVVDGKVIGILKDQEAADSVLNEIKTKYVPQKDQKNGKVVVLAAHSQDLKPGESELEQVDFVQKVDVLPASIQPGELDDPNELVERIQTGGVKENLYTVEKGDCLGCIAKKFNISKQSIYQNNPDIVEDFIKEGQQLNLTVLQPLLSVKTVEEVVENQEVQYDTEVITDDSMRAGVVQQVKPGKNGMKKVAFRVTKINGEMNDEEMIREEMVEEPVNAVVRKGTKVVLGEGSGKFAWPVVSASLTSGYGSRWGKLHKGVDLVSGNRAILASDNGKVVYAGYRNDYGNCIIIDHNNGYRTLYGHMSKLNVSVGKIVEKGENIGVMGSTGDSTGTHLHFEILRNESVENPLKYLNR